MKPFSDGILKFTFTLPNGKRALIFDDRKLSKKGFGTPNFKSITGCFFEK